ncbi:hypothetical protein MRQ47_004435 [Salmonella enterica]|nr:hypothetical protein [Salmonella enterica]
MLKHTVLPTLARDGSGESWEETERLLAQDLGTLNRAQRRQLAKVRRARARDEATRYRQHQEQQRQSPR